MRTPIQRWSSPGSQPQVSKWVVFAILRKNVAHLLVVSAELEADLVDEDLVGVDGAAAWTHED